MKNVIVRSLSGIVYIGLIVGAILGGWPYFAALTALFAVLGILEFSRLFHHEHYFAVDVINCLGVLALALAPIGIFYPGMQMMTYCCVLFIPAYFALRVVAAIFDLREAAFLNVAVSFAGIIYLGLPMLCLNAMYMMGGEITKWLVLNMFIMIWLNDTGAFCVGSTLGKRRLCERLSPKKSWEGFWGGFAFCLLYGLACYFWFNPAQMPLWAWLGMGAIVSVFATWGDLFESMIKRSQHVKDSGHLIPGHGGILDRIDSLLLVAPVMLVYLVLVLTWGQ